MPTSYQAPMAGDTAKQRSHSQSQASNTQSRTATVADVMSGNSRGVISIGPNADLARAVQVLRDERIGALVVTGDGGDLVGILSERDIVRKLAETPGQTLPQRVSAVMTETVQTCTMDEPLISVLKRMTAGKFRHMPVVANGAPVGMLTIGDVVNHRLVELEHEALQLKQLIVG